MTTHAIFVLLLQCLSGDAAVCDRAVSAAGQDPKLAPYVEAVRVYRYGVKA